MNVFDENHFFKYLDEASETVSSWPKWKQEGSDATRFLSDTQENNRQHTFENPVTME